MNYLICRGETETKVCLDEINTLIVQNTGVAVTAALLSQLLAKNIKVIFCDGKSNPQGELLPYFGAYNTYEKILIQLDWSNEQKDLMWSLIIKRKIQNQARNLKLIGREEPYQKLLSYVEEIQVGDVTNREGHAAKVYFNSCFGMDFSRGQDRIENTFLNYGYSIILSAINRNVKALGYLTEVGIHHIGGENPFNLSCDLMEPLRPMVDSFVLKKEVSEENYKERFIRMLGDSVTYQGKAMLLENAIHAYLMSFFSSLKSGDLTNLSFIEYELS